MTDYHVSPSGNDAADGSLGTPWETLDVFFSKTFAPGDRVLLERDGVYRGQLSFTNCSSPTTSGTPLTAGAYGSGALPVVTGWMLVDSADWVNQGGTVYSVAVASAVEWTCADDVYMTKGASTSVAVGEFYYTAGVLWVNTGGDVSLQKIEYSTSAFADNCSVNCRERTNIDYQVIENIAVEIVQMTATTGRGIGISGTQSHSGGVIIQNCEVMNAKSHSSIGVGIFRGGVIVRDCVIEGWVDGIYIFGSNTQAMPDILIQRCVLRNPESAEEFKSTNDAIKADTPSVSDVCDMTGSVIEDCDISGFHQDGIDFYAPTDGWTIRNNYVHAPAAGGSGNLDGIKSGSRNIEIYGNYITGLVRDGDNNFGYGLVVTEDDESHMHDNHVTGCLGGFTANAHPRVNPTLENNYFVGVKTGLNVGNTIEANGNVCDASLTGHGTTQDIHIRVGGVINGANNVAVNGELLIEGTNNMTGTSTIKKESNVLAASI